MLQQLSQLSEGTQETEKGRVHKADPGGYGRKFDTDEEGDEKKDDKKKTEPAAKRGRGRPKKGADSETGQVAKYDNAKNLQSFMVGNLPGGKPPGKPGKKHSLKEWVEEVEQKYVQEAAPGQQLTVKPMPGAAQLVDPASNKVMATGDAAAIKNVQGAVAQGKVQMRGEEMANESDEDYSAKKARAGKDIGKPGKQFAKIAKGAAKKYGSEESGKKVAGAVLAKLRKKVSEADIPSDQNDMGAGLGAGRNAKTFEGKKPDFLDLDKDKNKKEPMSDAAKDAEKKKKKLKENAHRHSSAKLLGKAHALAKEAYNCKFDDLDEVKMYHEGYKEGLDECYGQGVYEAAPSMPPATVGGMAGQAETAMEADMEEGNAFTKALAQTPQGGKFTVGGKSFTDRSNYDSDLGEMAFESLDKQLNALLNENAVSEGMSVSISKGNQGAPDSVSVTAQDAEADQLLAMIKQSGLGLFGQEGAGDFGVPSDGAGAEKHGEINVVGDHDGMMSLIKKVTGASSEEGSNDYEDEEGHDDHEHEGHGHTEEGTCNECGYMESECQCDEEAVMGEEESYDQEEEIAAEDNAPDSDEAETTADENAEAQEDQALATADEEQVTEWANDAGQDAKEFSEETFTTNEKFINKTLAGGLNKPKSTGQTTVPVVASQMNRQMAYESILDIRRLAGIK